jgi:hypothetical protein
MSQYGGTAMSDKTGNAEHCLPRTEEELYNRRNFLIGLKKWSKAVIGGVLFAAALTANEKEASAGWINRRGGWINGAGGYRGGSWVNGAGGGWANRRGLGGWLNSY